MLSDLYQGRPRRPIRGATRGLARVVPPPLPAPLLGYSPARSSHNGELGATAHLDVELHVAAYLVLLYKCQCSIPLVLRQL